MVVMKSGRPAFVESASPRRVERFWQAWKMGLSYEALAVEVGMSWRAVDEYLKRTGGIAPDPWKDPDRYLSLEERFRIKELLQEGCSFREIARRMGRSPSTISREVRRGSPTHWRSRYRPTGAHRLAFENRRRPKPLKIPSNPTLLKRVQKDLDNRWSPEQIARRLRAEYPERKDLHVSHETIYKTIYLQARGGLKRELKALTRTGRTVRHAQRRADQRRGRIKGLVSIWDRPLEALDRAVPGHWEGDLIVGKNGASAIATIVERRSNYLILGRLDPTLDRVSATQKVLAEKLAELPPTLRRTLTWDRGREMAYHHQVSIATGIEVYFADPHAPWQRATNENTNGLLREYFPKGTDLSGYSQEDLDAVADQMNNRPRKRLQFATPYEKMTGTMLLRRPL